MTRIQQGATSAIILSVDNNILLVERSITDNFLPGFWELPGGGMEYGETPQESLIREINEECGISIDIIKPVAANTYFIKDLQRIEITFLCKAKPDQIVKLSAEHTNYKWLPFKEIRGLKLSDYIKNILESSKEYLA